MDTQAMTKEGMRVVLRTQLRLFGDAQTDILRAWHDDAAPALAETTVRAHFQSVAEASSGFAAALGLERLARRAAMLFGTLFSAGEAIFESVRAKSALTLLTHWWLLFGVAFALLGLAARPLLSWRLRARFRAGLAPRS